MSLYEDSNINYEWKGDYLGFSLGGVHSSTLGITRISDSDRYNEDLIPVSNDVTATVPGLDETYYFGTTYTQKPFTIKFAFDSLTDSQIRKLRKLFSKKEPQELIFDEVPYKVYCAKCSGQPKLSYLCFDEENERIYKGDGEVNLVAYLPFAKSRFKYMEDYNITTIPEWGGTEENKMEWLGSSGIKSKNTKYKLYCPIGADRNNTIENYIDINNLETYEPQSIQDYLPERQLIPIINSGDIETAPEIELCYRTSYYDGNVGTPSSRYLTLYLDYAKLGKDSQGNDAYVVDEDKKNSQKFLQLKLDTRCYVNINMRTRLIKMTYVNEHYVPMKEVTNPSPYELDTYYECYSEEGESGTTLYRYKKATGNFNRSKTYFTKREAMLANNLITGGDFFQIPPIEENELLILRLDITPADSMDPEHYKHGEISSLKYNYYYY